MTREEIIAKWERMTPREHDAWIAEVVFGIDVHYEHAPHGPIYLDKSTLLSGRRHIRDYTASISSAWTVVERFSTEFLVRRRLGGTDYRAWVMLSPYNPERGVHAHGKTAPEAIGLAALLAKSNKANQ